MNESKTDVVGTTDQEIVQTRTLDAPRELVWKAWTDAQHLSRWWGPVGFTTTTQRMEVAPGGQWRFVMHGPDGRDYQNQINFLEVVEPERLVYKHGGEVDSEPVNFQVTVTFEKAGESGNKTKLTMRSTFPSKDARDFVVREYNAIEGGKQTLSRLAEYLREIGGAGGSRGTAGTEGSGGAGGGSTAGRPFLINRVVNAPRDQVFKVWTQRDHLMRWFGPKGVTIPTGTLDLRPGGVFHYCMRGPDGQDMWGRWVFREITPPERLVFVVSFSDERGGVARAPFDSSWPLEMLSTVTFSEHAGIGRGTVITVEWRAINASEAESKTFDDGSASMQQGWSGTFEQLAEYLAKIKG